MDINKETMLTEIENAKTLNELNELKIKFLGKKSELAIAMSKTGTLPVEERAAYGAKINVIRKEITSAIDAKQIKLEEEEVHSKLIKEKVDISLPGYNYSQGSKAILNATIDEITDILIGMGYECKEGPEVEQDLYNFEMMNVPKGHPARDMQDTFYITENLLLRSQTSPVQARSMLEANGVAPIKMFCPGKVFRRDDDDATHSHQFTQMEGLVIDKHISMSDLKGTLEVIARKMFGAKREVRFRSSYFPFTEPSVEVDVSCFACGGKNASCSICKGTGWIEILGAGMVHPNVLKMGGFDPSVYQGFAFGMGIERIAMLRYGIDDIRNLYSNDIRVAKQFLKEE